MVPGLVLLRLAALPVLLRAQRATRRRALAAVGVDASAGPPGGVGAIIGELTLGLLFAAAVETLLYLPGNSRFYRMVREPIDVDNSRILALDLHISRSDAQLWYLVPVITGLVLWLLFWFLTQRNLLVVGMPEEVRSARSTRLRIGGGVLLRALIGAFLLPVILVIPALLFQAVALITSPRAKAVGTRVDQLPPPSIPQAYVPTQYTPPAPQHAPPAPQYAPPAPPAPYVPPVGQPLGAHEPRTIGGYQLLGRIGSGGMGTVYLAQRQGSATQVALKTINLELLDDAELLRRFQRESEVLAMVPGAYTARVLDSGVDQGRPYLAMELLDGRPLDVHLREQGPIRSADALRALALALAVALSGVHRLGLVHRDLKPANIMLTTAGPRLLDFGIAAIVDGTRLTMTGGGPGTLTYMAPEQFGDERAGTAADVWAWACCVVCAAHGASPFAATNTGAVIRRIVETGPEPAAVAAVRALDPGLAAVVTRALAIDPAQRPADGAALLAALAQAQQAAPDPAAVHDLITRGWQTLAL
ncbi:serine/threonine-protein kinase [Kitasatospora sp. NPDC093558]|uniref:serine/threonine-protein kinase n=1 Tax=Kitasatospora sp. NPDC093558 TaxID=3155201 RepID=UPI003421DC39